MNNTIKISSLKKEDTKITRRKFVALSAVKTVALSFPFIRPGLVRGYNANSKINIGIIGCGNRGNMVSQLFLKHGKYNIVAAADYFQDRADKLGDKFNIAKKHRYSGLSGYRKMLEQKLDGVVIESPPYFHPEQTATAVDAGRHVYLAKPIAVDVPGCNTIAQSGKKAASKKLCVLVDFQTRANQFFKEAVKQVHNGKLGKLVFGESTYHAGFPFPRMVKILKDDPQNPENRLKAWGLDKALSGDMIVEQNIHTLDVMSWIMNQAPLFAEGACGHKVRTDKGSCKDYYTLLFIYPNDVGITFSSRQFPGHGTQPDGIRNRMFGSLGVLETKYGGRVLIRGKNFYKGGKTSAIFKEGIINNIETFYNNITESRFDNITVKQSVRSNLVSILGRTAAYKREKITWDKIINNTEKMNPVLKGLKS